MTTAHAPTHPADKADTSAKDNAPATLEAGAVVIDAHPEAESPAGSEAGHDPVARTVVVRAMADLAAAEVAAVVAVAVDPDSVAAVPWDDPAGARAGLALMTGSVMKNASGCPSRPSPTSSTRMTRS